LPENYQLIVIVNAKPIPHFHVDESKA